MSAARRARAVLLGASLAWLAGCGFNLDAGGPLVRNECRSDADCPGARCDTAAEMCISPTSDRYLLGLEITPASDPVGGSPVTRSIGPFEVMGPADEDIVLPAPISVIGDVRQMGSGEAVAATMRFVRDGSFPGAPPVSTEASTVATPVDAADGAPADYALRVVADRIYRVEIEPTGEWAKRLPPLRVSRTVPGGGDFVRFNFEYPAELPVVHGIVVGGSDEPVDGLQVRAVDALSGRPVSSVAVTGEAGEPGTFSMTVDPEAGPWLIRIRAGADRPLFPTLLADPAYLFPDEMGNARIRVPMLSRIRYQGSVGLLADETGLERVEGAVLTFTALDVQDITTGIQGAFRATVTADSRGEFEAEVLPGTYEVLVTPPAELRSVGIVAETVRIDRPADGDTLRGQLFELPLRKALEGTLTTPDGRVMPQAMISAIALGRELLEGGSPAARYNRSSDATTDLEGAFALSLDEGVYDLRVQPPMGAGFAWIVRPEATVIDGMGPDLGALVLAAPVPFDGTVVEAGPEALPAGGAEIRAYAILEGADGSSRALELGRAMTAPDGTFRLLLPPSL